jgi:hypothetical protein
VIVYIHGNINSGFALLADCFKVILQKNKHKMEKVLFAISFFLFTISYAILILPALIVLIIADLIKEKRPVKMFDPVIMQNFEG